LYFTDARAISALTGQSNALFTNGAGYLIANQNITLSGEASGAGSTSINVTLSNAAVIAKVLTGYVSGAGVVSATDTILSAIQKLNGNIVANTYVFSTGLTNTSGTITNNLSVGVVGGQTAIGGTGIADALTYKSTTGNATTTAAGHIFTGGNNGATTILSLLNNGNANLTGVLGVGAAPVANQPITASLSSNAAIISRFINGTNGTAAISILAAQNSAGLSFSMQKHSPSFTTSGLITASTNLLNSNSGNIIYNSSVAGTFQMWTIGGTAATNELMRLSETGLSISGAATGKITTPTALLHLAAGGTAANSSPLKFASAGNLLTTPEAGAIEFNGTDWFATRSSTRGTVYVSAPRLHSSVSLAVNTARTPSATRDVEVIITFNLAGGSGATAQGNVQVDNSGGGTFTTIAVTSSTFAALLGLGSTQRQTVTFTVPQGSQYRWTTSDSGGAATTVVSIYELIR